jgi:hypothetical protein
MSDLAEMVAELYALPPEDFVAARTECVKRAREGKDRTLATAVSKLPKPTTAAWLLNLLVRERPAQVGELVALGDAMREAQQNLSGPQLRQLGRKRHEVLAAFTSMALAPAERSGRPVTADLSAQVQETLAAAIADPDAGQALLSGRLTKGLSYVGLGDVGVDPADGSGPQKQQTSPAAGHQRRGGQAAAARERARAEKVRQREAAQAELERLELRAGAAAQALEVVRREADGARAEVDTRRARADELRVALAEAEAALAEAEAGSAAIATREQDAQQHADDADAALERARSTLTDLE